MTIDKINTIEVFTVAISKEEIYPITIDEPKSEQLKSNIY